MQKFKFLFDSAFIFAIFISMLFSASISGVVYDESLNPVKGAIVTLMRENVTYNQFITNSSGIYQFNVSGGNYQLIAFFPDNNAVKSTVSLNLSDADSVRIDLILIPELGVEPPDIVTPELKEEEFILPFTEVGTNWIVVGFFVSLFIALLFIIYLALKRKTEELEKELVKKIETIEERPLGKFLTDEERIYQIIRRYREIPQKNIVIETGFSKAKISLILRKLEKLGKISRTHVGREKIVKIIE